MKNFVKGKIELKKQDNRITVIASDETLDRHGDVLPIDMWDVSKFVGSPRMLVDHDHQVEKIVGKWENIRFENGKMLMDANFHGITELSKAVQQMVEEGYLDTVSVGFIVHGPERDGDKGRFELIETSWVTVPANPNAKIEASLKSLLKQELSDDQKKKIKDFAGEEPDEPESDDFLPDDEEEELGNEEDEKIIGSVEEFRAVKSQEVHYVKCTVLFIEKLVEDSEKLMTLTQENEKKVEAKKDAELVKLALKEAARQVNDSLRKLNKVS